MNRYIPFKYAPPTLPSISLFQRGKNKIIHDGA